jgi:D-aminopeptidase
MARRLGLGIARTGSTGHHSSGEIFLGLAIGLRAPRGESVAIAPITGRGLDPYFEAAVDAAEEAVLSSLLHAHDVTGVEGRTIPALPLDDLRRLLAEGPTR